MLNVIWNLTIFIITLCILITVHEFGHFWSARRCGVQVECFSIGFGKAIWKFCDQYGTEFIIAMIPLGGYVKMLDERISLVPSEIRHKAFNSKTISKRAIIITSGSLANFILAIFAYWLVFIIGITNTRPVIKDVIPNSIVAKEKITPGMELKAIDGIKVLDWDSVRLQLVSKIGNDHVTVSVTPFNSNVWQDKILDLRHWTFDPNKDDPIIALGINPHNVRIELILTQVKTNSLASKAGLQTGDKIVTVNGKPLINWTSFINIIQNNVSNSLILGVERDNNLLSITFIPDKRISNIVCVKNFFGMIPKIISLPDEYQVVQQYDPISAIFNAIDKTWQLTKLTVQMIGKLIHGSVKLSSLSGPISIAQGAGISAKFGITHYLMFLALISVNLGVINQLPFPVLDGGHLLFLAIEKLKGKPVSEQIQTIIYHISSILLLLLMGLAIFNDFSRL